LTTRYLGGESSWKEFKTVLEEDLKKELEDHLRCAVENWWDGYSAYSLKIKGMPKKYLYFDTEWQTPDQMCFAVPLAYDDLFQEKSGYAQYKVDEKQQSVYTIHTNEREVVGKYVLYYPHNPVLQDIFNRYLELDGQETQFWMNTIDKITNSRRPKLVVNNRGNYVSG